MLWLLSAQHVLIVGAALGFYVRDTNRIAPHHHCPMRRAGLGKSILNSVSPPRE